MKLLPFCLGLAISVCNVRAVSLDLNDLTSIQAATSLISQGLMDYYNGLDYGETIGMFSNPYYWWEAGAAWNSILDYGFYLQNDTYNDILKQALLYQTGTDDDYIPSNQSTTEGNDDQAFWGITVMAATERNFTNPPSYDPQWLSLAQAVFNTMALRWDDDNCGGGLRWQIFTWNSGYDYKNSVSNGALFHMAARLARYTSNDSYTEWAEKVWDWMVDVNFISTSTWWFVYDGASLTTNCTTVQKLQWTYNQGLMLAGCAYLYNYTEDSVWLNRTENLLTGSQVFFKNNVMYEAACQNAGNCNNDQRSFKAIFSRFLGLTSVMAPTTYDKIHTYLEASANAAAQSCSGGTDGHTCGLNWSATGWDGYYGLGEQMSALEVIQNFLAPTRPAPYTASAGGTSTGNGAAGTFTVNGSTTDTVVVETKDKAGAGVITVIFAGLLIAGSGWVLS